VEAPIERLYISQRLRSLGDLSTISLAVSNDRRLLRGRRRRSRSHPRRPIGNTMTSRYQRTSWTSRSYAGPREC